MPATIPVHTSRGQYEVRIESGLLARTGAELRAHVAPPPARVAVVTDSNVAPLHLPRVMQSLAEAGFDAAFHIFPAGEASKTLATAAAILDFLARERFTRTDLVLALGGGVVGDVAGFAAAIYLRGVRVVQVPTTFLAAIDSSVGGKTAVDLPAGKNLCGAFWQPARVLCDPEALATLPPEILHDGCAEAIKYGVIADRPLFDLLADGNLAPRLEEVVARCVGIKAEIVARDEFDRGDRALLNFGHTIGHAIEKCSNFAISHGAAVGIGMVRIAEIAARQGWSKEDCAPAIAAALRRYSLPVSTSFTPADLLPAMLSDKKRAGGEITLVVPEAIGRCVRHPVPVAELKELL